jgi:DNA primase
MQFTPSFLDELRSRIGLADLVGRKVRLQKRGREHIGLCPFHNEKSPSFAVVEEKGFFHCFGCGAHGDAIGFVMRSESLSFPEAVERLASEAGLPMPVFDPQERVREQRRATVGQAIEVACAWFEAQLRKPVGRQGLDYLRRRGLDDDVIAQFRLGYAPGGGAALRTTLNQQGIEDTLLLEAGLIIAAEDGRPARDFFRERVTFPIADRRGRVIAFGARSLGDEKPKYLNSRDTDLFHKGTTLYNLAKARAVAADTSRLVVAEGYMDVIALHQAGIASGVAPLGTALTEDQLGLMWKIVPEPVLCLDGDAAGMRAALRAALRALPLLSPGRSLRFALLPEGEDPDSLLRSRGPQAVTAALERALPLAELLWRSVTGNQSADTPERKAGLRQTLMETARKINDPVVREHYTAEFENRFRETFLPRRTSQWSERGRRPVSQPGQKARVRLADYSLGRDEAGTSERREQALLGAVLNHPAVLESIADELDEIQFQRRDLDSLRVALLKIARSQGGEGLDAAGLKSHFDQTDYAGLVRRLTEPNMFGPRRFAHPSKSVSEVLAMCRQALEQIRLPQIKAEVEQAGNAPDATKSTAGFDRVRWLQEEFERLNRVAASLD